MLPYTLCTSPAVLILNQHYTCSLTELAADNTAEVPACLADSLWLGAEAEVTTEVTVSDVGEDSVILQRVWE